MQTGSNKRFQQDIDRIKAALQIVERMETETLAVQTPLLAAKIELENVMKVLTVYMEHPEFGVQYQRGDPGAVRIIANRKSITDSLPRLDE